METIQRYLGLTDGFTRCIGLAIIASAGVSAMLAAYWPIVLGECFSAISQRDSHSVLSRIIIFSTILFLYESLGFIRRVATDCMITRHERQLRFKSLRKMLRMPICYHEHAMSGESTAQMNQGVSGFSQILKLSCNDILPAILTSCSVIAAVIVSAPPAFSCIMITYAFLAILLSCLQIRSQKGIREHILRLKTRLDGLVTQELQNLEQIRCRNADEQETNRLAPEMHSIETTERRHHLTMGSYDITKKGLQVLTFGIILVFCYLLSQNGNFNAGSSVTIVMLFQQLLAPVDAVYRCLDELSSSLTRANILNRLFAHPEDPHYLNSTHPSSSTNQILSIRNGCVFTPDGKSEIAKSADFTVESNDRILLDGPSGCGKTSLIRALVGYYPYEGSIRFQNVEIKDLSPGLLAQNILYIPQSPIFFCGTVRDNLLFGLVAQPSEEQLVNALAKARLLQDLTQSSTNPFLHPIDEGARNLSAGQRQRLALARIFLSRFRLLILDEATANLDAKTGNEVMEAINEYAKSLNAAIIFISHDAATRQHKTLGVTVHGSLARQRNT